MSEPFVRNTLWLGEGDQQVLKNVRLAIVGAGGIGWLLGLHCTALGFHKMTLVDPDLIELSNLNRLLGARQTDAGKSKVRVLRSLILRMNPDAKVLTHQVRIETKKAEKAITHSDIVLGAVDSVDARLAIQIFSAIHKKTYIDFGTGFDLPNRWAGGQAICYQPGGPCIFCAGFSLSKTTLGYLVESTGNPMPSSTILNSCAVAYGLNLLLAAVLSKPRDICIRFDMITNAILKQPVEKRKNCAICGDQGIEESGKNHRSVLKSKTDMENFLCKT